jgi:hypothetical protein
MSEVEIDKELFWKLVASDRERIIKDYAARIEALEAALRHIEAQCTEAISYGHTNINGVLTTIARATLAPEQEK